MNITTTVSWATLISAPDDELAEYREAYQELKQLAAEVYDAALDDPTSDEELQAIQQQAHRYERGVEEIQKRQAALERIREACGDGDFEIKMLSGEETIEIESQLRADAQQQDMSGDEIQSRRNALVVDAATVSTPEGVPENPSEAPNQLTLTLWEQVESFNSAGAVDFTAAGCGGEDAESSPTPSIADESPVPSAPTDET